MRKGTHRGKRFQRDRAESGVSKTGQNERVGPKDPGRERGKRGNDVLTIQKLGVDAYGS